MCDPAEACRSLNGELQPDGACVWENRKHTAIPPCRAAVAQRVAKDEYGACYSFMVTEEGGVRERYRFTDGGCITRFTQFEQMSNMCTAARGWTGELGKPLPPPPAKDLCAAIIAKDTCENSHSHCSWNDTPRTLTCSAWPSDEGGSITEELNHGMCKAMCDNVGGKMSKDGGECSLPSCLKASY